LSFTLACRYQGAKSVHSIDRPSRTMLLTRATVDAPTNENDARHRRRDDGLRRDGPVLRGQ
jgi:hypothetical protein